MEPLNKTLYIITKHPSQKFDISFINLQINTILQNLKQTLTSTNLKFIQQICMRKNYQISKHPNKKHLLQKI